MRLYGKQPVIERLRANPSTVRKVYLQEGFVDAAYVKSKSRKHGFPVISIPRTKMMKIARNTNTQGILAETDDFLYVPYDELLDQAIEKHLTILFLDDLTDPQNLGSIIRCVSVLGGFAVVFPTHNAVNITDTVLRVACGGENYIPIARVSSIQKAIRRAKEEEFSIIGAVAEGGENLLDAKFSFPLGLVVGSEEKGISENVLKDIEQKLTVPMKIHTLSLNVASATSIFCYEIAKQRKR